MRLVISSLLVALLIVTVLGNLGAAGQAAILTPTNEPTPTCIIPGIGDFCTPTPTAQAATPTATPSCIVPGIGDLCTPTPTATGQAPPTMTPTPTDQPGGQSSKLYWLPAAFR